MFFLLATAPPTPPHPNPPHRGEGVKGILPQKGRENPLSLLGRG